MNTDECFDLQTAVRAALSGTVLFCGFYSTVLAQTSTTIDLSNLNGRNGFIVKGIEIGDLRPGAATSAGDINGDGIDDVIIGAVSASPNGNIYAGQSYLLFGNSLSFPSSFELSTLDGSNGVIINGINAFDRAGRVGAAGDINGDGLDDFVIGAPGVDANGIDEPGACYVIFGTTAGFESPFQLSDLNNESGFVINGIARRDRLAAASEAGDFNHDGVDDLLLSSTFADINGELGVGQVYIVFGKTTGFGDRFDLSDLDGENGLIINGRREFDFTGNSLSQAGDVNGDGIDDILIGAMSADYSGNTAAGLAYLVYGSDSGLEHPFELNDLDETNGAIFSGDVSDQAGNSVSGGHDVNQDGLKDLLIGAIRGSPIDNGVEFPGRVFIIFGDERGYELPLFLNDIDSKDGVIVDTDGRTQQFGASVSFVGDTNADGIDDFIIGAPSAGVFDQGFAYTLFGSDNGFVSPLNVSSLMNSDGFSMRGSDDRHNAGSFVADIGDINNDGLSDFSVSTNTTGVTSMDNPGELYIVFGRELPQFKNGFESLTEE